MKYGVTYTKDAKKAKAGEITGGVTGPGYVYIMWTTNGMKRWYKTPYEASKALESYLTTTVMMHPISDYSVVKCPDHLVTDSDGSPQQLDMTIKGRLMNSVDSYLATPVHKATVVEAPPLAEEVQYVVPFIKTKDPSDSNLF